MASFHIQRLTRVLAVAALAIMAAPTAFAVQEWSEPVHVSVDDTADIFKDEAPRLAVDETGNVVALWLRSAEAFGSAADIVVASSFDGGVTFTKPFYLNVDANGTAADSKTRMQPRNGLAVPVTDASVVYAGENNWVALWTKPSGVPNEYNVFVKRSQNNGLTWSAEQHLYSGPLQTGRFDIASDKAGAIVATFNTRLLRSIDFGATWAPMSDPFPIVIDEPNNGDAPYHFDADIATNGNGTWVQAHTVFYSYGLTNYIQIVASTSTDNGQTWNQTLRRTKIFYIMEHDVAMMGNTAVISFSITNPAVYVSSDNGLTWSDEKSLPSHMSIGLGLALAAGDGYWTLLTSIWEDPDQILSYVTEDPMNWTAAPERVTSDTADENYGAVAALPGGNVLALLETNRAAGTEGPDYDIYATILNNGGTIPPAEAGPDIAMSSGGEVKAKLKKKTQEYLLSWKAIATNVGEADAEGFVVRFWLSDNDELDNGDTLLSEQFVKTVKAAKPGKKAKSKKVKLKATVGSAPVGLVIAEVVNPAEPADENNFTAQALLPVW